MKARYAPRGIKKNPNIEKFHILDCKLQDLFSSKFLTETILIKIHLFTYRRCAMTLMLICQKLRLETFVKIDVWSIMSVRLTL